MPRLRGEVELKIIELIDQGDKDAVISRKLGVHRTTVANRREAHFKRKQKEEKPEAEQDLTQKPDQKIPEPETKKIIQQEQTGLHPLDPQIYTLIRYQGSNSREEALSQAIETQHSFNPYILNHGFNTPAELVKFFEDELKLERALAKDLITDDNINRSLIVDYKATIAELEELAEERYEEGKKDYALFVPCTGCGQLMALKPGDDVHGYIIDLCRRLGIMHIECRPKYERVRTFTI